MNKKVCIVFFAKGQTRTTIFGYSAVDRFMSSYLRFNSGMQHRLVFAVNGWDNLQDELILVNKLASEYQISLIKIPDEGLDIGVYFRIAHYINSQYFLFLNTHCEICANNYLKIFYSIIKRANVGLVGSTGSMEYFKITLLKLLTSKIKYLSVKQISKILIHIPFITDYANNKKRLYDDYADFLTLSRYIEHKEIQFPNPHIRTSSFFISRKMLLDYSQSISFPQTKTDTLDIESGKNSMTSFVLQKGLDVVVAGADGQAYSPSEWVHSKTFRTPDCSNLLIKDKHTRIYDSANIAQKRRLEKMTWGKQLS